MWRDLVLPGGTVVSGPVVARVAGMPAGVLAPLRRRRSLALARLVDRHHRRLRRDGAELSLLLHPAVGATPSGVDRAALVGLRRAVFQVRTPNSREWNPGTAAALPGDLAARVAAWLAARQRLDRTKARLATTLVAESTAATEALRAAVAAPAVRRALVYASESLSAETDKWLADPSRRPRRQVLDRLAKYVARAALKTSPYSSFTSCGTASWADTGPAVRLAPHHAGAAVVELNGFLWRQVVAAAPQPPLRLNPSAVHDGATVRFLGRPPDEPMVGLPATPAVRSVLRAFAGGSGLTTAELARRLDPNGGRAAEAGRFLARLLELGLLQPDGPGPDLTSDPLGDLAGWLAAHRRDADAALLRGLRRTMGTPARLADVPGHRAWHRAVHDQVREVCRRFAATPANGVDVVHETTVVTGDVAALGAARWRPALADLDVVRRVLAAVDPDLPFRLALTAYCAERFGAGSRVPLLTLHAEVARELGGPGRGPTAGDLVHAAGPARTRFDWHSPRLRDLALARADLHRLLLARPDAPVDPQAVVRLMEGWPRWLARTLPVVFYVQPVPSGGGVELVVNVAHGGDGRGRSRVLHLLRRAGAAPPDLGLSEPPDGIALAEFGASFGVSLNARDTVAPYEIDYPHTVGRAPHERRIPIHDLTVVHDAEEGRLRLLAGQARREIRVAQLGMMADGLLPPAARLLTRAFGAGYYLHPTIPLPPHGADVAATGRVVREPRVQIGRVVLRRARWIVPAALVPAPGAGESAADFLVRLVAWCDRHALPDRFMARMLEPGDGLLAKGRKPVPVDVADGFLLSSFGRMLRGRTGVLLVDELLPAPETAPGGRVAEYLVELRPAAGRG
jgi:hypothetical protein